MRLAAIQGMSPLSVLKSSHSEVKEYLVQYEALGKGEGLKKKELLHPLRQTLDIQLALEGGLLYPSIRGMNQAGGSRFVEVALRNHAGIKTLLKELTVLDGENRTLDLKMDALIRCVLHHLELERMRIASLLRVLSEDFLRDMNKQMRAMRDRLRLKQSPAGQKAGFPTPLGESGPPEDDPAPSDPPRSPTEVPPARPTDFENWGSE